MLSGTTEETLKEFFTKYGPVDSVKVPRFHGMQPKGYAFVVFSNPETYQAVIEEGTITGFSVISKCQVTATFHFNNLRAKWKSISDYDAQRRSAFVAPNKPFIKRTICTISTIDSALIKFKKRDIRVCNCEYLHLTVQRVP